MTVTAPEPEWLESLYHAMERELGPTGWWPADGVYEIMVGAVLTQNTAWRNVDRSLDALKSRGVLDPHAIAGIDAGELRELIGPSGFQRNKSRALIGLSRWFVNRCGADPASVAAVPDDDLRRELLTLFGVGGETADDLMLYVFDRRAFVADAYARRLLTFCGWEPPAGYSKFRDAIIASVLATSLNTAELREFHGLIDEFGKAYRDDDAKDVSFLADWKDSLRS